MIVFKHFENLQLRYRHYRMQRSKFLFELTFSDQLLYLIDIINPWDAEWRKWFAWRPVKLRNGKWTWLSTVYTRKNILRRRNGKRIKVKVGPTQILVSTQHYRLYNSIYISREAATLEKLTCKPKHRQVHKQITYSPTYRGPFECEIF